MTVEKAQEILLKTDIKVAFHHRFAFDSGTMLRLDNDAMVAIFDDGRYYLQGENTENLVPLFEQVEKPWDPNTWTGEMPGHHAEQMLKHVLPWFAPRTPPKRT